MPDYDSIPYESLPFSETHPQRLAVLGRLFGIATKAAEDCRVLEIGCASGGNLIPMAWRLPHSEFIGIDLSAEQIRVGQQTIKQLSLKNISLHQFDLCEYQNQPGSFDYIIAHGVYSWVPAPVRDALLALVQRHLAPDGVAYISYNTQPGWSVRSMLRTMALYHARHLDEPHARLNSMLELFDFLRDYYQHSKNPLQQQLYAELKAIVTAHPSYLYHDFLEEDNAAVFFNEFVAHIGGHHLKYLCESELHTMFCSTLPIAGERFVEQYDDILEQEQYIDHLRQRTFRMSLLVHDNTEPNYDIDLTLLGSFAAHSQLLPPDKLFIEKNKEVKFMRPDGGDIKVQHTHVKLALQYLYESASAAIEVDSLFDMASTQLAVAGIKTSTQAKDEYYAEMFNLFSNSCIDLVLTPQVHGQALADYPCLNALAAAEMAVGNVLSGAWHEPIHLDQFAEIMIENMNGNNDTDAIVSAILSRVSHEPALAAALNINLNQEAPRLRRNIETNVRRLILVFARHGILEANMAQPESAVVNTL